MKKVLGGEVIAAMLAAEGVEKVFGIVDGTYLGLFASFEKYGIELISPRHESTAAHMAGAYARLTGRLGVCIASNGPGVANILPGVAVENGEGNRVLLITSCRRQGIAYPERGGTFQYFDQVGVTAPMTKWSGAVPSFERIGELTRRALRISWQGRPGVVHLDVPENILNGTYEVEALDVRAPAQYRRVEPIAPSAAQVRAAADLLRTARRPVLHAGSGVVHAGAFEELEVVAEALQAPMVSSWGGRVALRDASPLALPTALMQQVNDARSGADVVLVLGSRLGETDWWGKPPYWGGREQKIIQVDIDDQVLGQSRPTEIAILADAKLFLRALALELRATPVAPAILAERRAQNATLFEAAAQTRAAFDSALENEGAPIHPARVPEICDRIFADDAVLVIDGGNTAVWTNFFHRVRAPNTVLSTFKMGMLGAGVGQALGAKAAFPDRQVYCILGDGAMGFHPQELETAVRSGLPVVYVVLCDKQWGMVKLTQTVGLGEMRRVLGVESEGTINADLGEIAFDDLARSMGAHGERVSSPDELGPALERCLAAGKAAVVHVDVDPVQHLFAPGLQEFKAMHQEP